MRIRCKLSCTSDYREHFLVERGARWSRIACASGFDVTSMSVCAASVLSWSPDSSRLAHSFSSRALPQLQYTGQIFFLRIVRVLPLLSESVVQRHQLMSFFSFLNERSASHEKRP